MTDDKWLRDGLADAVPTPPASPGRADGARAMARRARRTTGLAIGGAAASVLLAAGVVAALQDGKDPKDGTDVVASPFDVPACATDPGPADSGPTSVPAGAVSVRLCSTSEAIGFRPSADALVTDVDALVEAVNGLPDSPTDPMCTMDLGRAYQLVFRYADREPVVAGGELYGCHEVTVGGAKRQDAQVPWDRFNELLAAQRADLDPPPPPSAGEIDCTDPMPSATPGPPADLVVAALCVEDVQGSGASQRADISADDLAVLREDLAVNVDTSAGMPRCAQALEYVRLVGMTAWGDVVELPSECGNGRYVVAYDPYTVWTPGTEAAAIIERLVGEAR